MNNNWNRFVLLAFILVVPVLGLSQQWTSFTPQNTSTILADNTVHAVVVDKNNVLWFGTEGGVSKFDGTTWTNFNSNNSGLTDNFVNCIYIDTFGNKWIGTNNGVYKYNDTDWIHYNVANSGIANNVVNSVLWVKGIYWFATYGGVSRFNGFNWSTYTSLDGLAADMVYSVTIDLTGKMWFGTAGGGASCYDGNAWTTYNTSNGLADNGVSTIFVDNLNNKWFGTWGGLNKLSGTNFKTYNKNNSGLPDNSIQSIAQTKDGTMWFGTWNQGAVSFKGSNWNTYDTQNGLAHFRVYGIAIDSLNQKWFATGFGVSRLNGTTSTNYYTNGLVSGIIKCMTIDKNGKKWFGTKKGIASFNDSQWVSYENNSSLLAPQTQIYAIAEDRNNNIWVTTNFDGLFKYDGSVWEQNGILPDKFLRGIAVDTLNHLWIGTQGGIKEFDGINWISHTEPAELADNFVTAVGINKFNHKWIGGEMKGVSYFNGNIWTKFNTSNSILGSNRITSITFDQSGYVWLGTLDGGVSFCDGTNWQSYTKVNGLADNKVLSVAVDKDGNKWMGTNGSGVTMYDNTYWTTFTTTDGLYNDVVNAISVDNKGYIWFCTNGGISRYHPKIPGQGLISGNIVACRNTTNNTYSVNTVTGATSYEWTLPAGATGSSTTNTIQVNFGIGAESGMIMIKAKNAFGEGNTTSKYILVKKNLPAQAGVITGKTSVKKNTNNLTYIVGIIEDASSYIWTIPAGVTGTSISNAIMLNFSSSAVSGYISVKGHNECGDGLESKLYITITGIKENDLSDKIEVYPNPFNEKINVNLEKSLLYMAELKLYDISGRCIIHEPFNESEFIINTSDFPSGIYTLKITTNEGVYAKLIVK